MLRRTFLLAPLPFALPRIGRKTWYNKNAQEIVEIDNPENLRVIKFKNKTPQFDGFEKEFEELLKENLKLLPDVSIMNISKHYRDFNLDVPNIQAMAWVAKENAFQEFADMPDFYYGKVSVDLRIIWDRGKYLQHREFDFVPVQRMVLETIKETKVLSNTICRNTHFSTLISPDIKTPENYHPERLTKPL